MDVYQRVRLALNKLLVLGLKNLAEMQNLKRIETNGGEIQMKELLVFLD